MTLPFSPRVTRSAAEAFLRVPPFPGARLSHFVERAGEAVDLEQMANRLRALRVGGSYWGTQPKLPGAHVLVRSPGAAAAAGEIIAGAPLVHCGVPTDALRHQEALITAKGDCDPWHMLSEARALIAAPGDELHLIAALLGVSRYDWDGCEIEPSSANLIDLLEPVATAAFENPFTGDEMNAVEAAELCGFWRRLIDSNRHIAGGFGFAFWKQTHVGTLLWSGAGEFPFLRKANQVKQGAPVAIWRSKVSGGVTQALERNGNLLVDVEDGFLRSQGLGADCIPPLSIVVDKLGPHFDPSQPSDLELLLQDASFDERLLERARALRRIIVEAGVGKYGRGTGVLQRPAGKRRHILVPGQVEDDRAVQAGGCGLVSNLDLLMRVRERAPDAYILYKPHPDVEAGHRRGAIPDAQALRHADRIVADAPIAALLSMVDEVHVNSSLAGFEALLRGRAVTTYGVPFYSGWGLTTDLGPVPARRNARRTLDELVAAALLIYPRYLDPVSGLPCPAETAVSRLCSTSAASDASAIVGVRRLQGKVMRQLRRLVQ